MKIFYVAILLLCGPILVFAQDIRGRVLNQFTNEPLAFVTIVEEGTQNGTYSDIDGYFRIKRNSESSKMVFSYIGFEPKVVAWDGSTLWIVKINARPILTKEVVIRPGENPAEVIMKKVLRNKDRNNPEKSVAFVYDSYNKLVFLGIKDTLKPAAITASNSLDSSTSKKKDFFDDKHLFLLESATTRKHLPPDKDEEIIHATRVSGLKNPEFALLGTQLQSFSLYGNEVSLMDISYLSPLTDGAINKYLFILEDSTIIGNDTVYTISFQPRRNKNFHGLKGQLFINSDHWALQNAIASPADSAASLSIRIQQQYSKKEGVWFPEQLNSFLTFPEMKVNDIVVTGVSRSYIRNIKINPPLRKRDFGPVVLSMAPRATQVPDSVWTTYREHELDVKEIQTYHYMDSVGKAENFDKKLKLFGIIGTGKIPLGKISVDANRILRINSYEGIRLGAGLHTNEFLSERFSIGGYYAYGFKDEAQKYGGDLLVHLYRKRNAWVQLSYENDVIETGGRQLEPRPGSFLNTNYYPFFISRMDAYEKVEAAVNGRLIGTLSANIFAGIQKIDPYKNVTYKFNRTHEADLIIRTFTMQEAGVTVRWAPGEKLAVAGQREMSMGSKFPVVYFRYTYGQIDELDKLKGFNRMDALIEKTFKTALTGDLTCRLSVGYLPEDVPASLYYNAKGTNNIHYDRRQYIGIASPYTFETMRTNEFMHSEFIAVHLRHEFKDLLFKAGKFRPQISLVQNMLWGRLKNPGINTIAASNADKGYHESGISIDRLLHSGFSNLGLAFFYRYGEYALGKSADNIIIKLSASVGF